MIIFPASNMLFLYLYTRKHDTVIYMNHIVTEKRLHETFEISIILKGLHSILEILVGFLILCTTKTSILSFTSFLTASEIKEDPHDFLALYFVKIANNFSISGQYFITIYLLSHGIIKLFVIYGLYKKKMWAYSISIIVFTLFIIYQLYRHTFTHSIWLLLFTIFDSIIILLTIHEWHRATVYIQGTP